MDPEEKRSLKASSYASYLSYIVRMPLGFLLNILLIKCLTQEDYGSYQIIISINTAVIYLTSFGLASVFARYVPEFIERRCPDNLIKLTVWGVFIRLFFVFIILVLAYSFSQYIYDFFSFTPFLRKYFYLVLVFVFFSRLEEAFGPTLLGAYLEQVRLAIIGTIQAFLRTGVVFYAFYANSGLKTILIGLISVEVFIATISIIASTQIISYKTKAMLNTTKIVFPTSRIIRFGSFSYLLASTGVFRDVMVDNFVISHYLNMTQVAVYGFAYTILNIVSSLNPINLLKNLIGHLIIRKHVQENDSNLFHKVHRLTMTVSMGFLLPLLGFLLLFLKDIIKLINRDYYSSSNLIAILSSLIIFNAMTYSYVHCLNTLEKMQYRFYANIFSIYNLVADIVLIQFFGLYGVAIATSSASLFTIIYYHYVVTRIFNIRISYYWPAIVRIIVNMGLALILSRISFYFSNTNITIATIVFGLAYCISSYLFNPLHIEDQQILKRLIWKNY